MIRISLCMIVKNEEDVLARCLECAKQFVDEIIIVDTGSSDKTKAIANKYTNHVYDFIWCDDFSKARNYAFSKASKEYCMWLDADDIIFDSDIENIIKLKETLSPEVSIVMMKYHTAFDEHNNPTFSYYRERLIKNNEQHEWEGVVHEVIPLVGKLQYEDIAITHKKIKEGDAQRNLRIFESLLNKGITLGPREQFYYARELYYHARYQDAIRMFHTFLEEGRGWIENNIDACEMMGYCYYQIGDEKAALHAFYRSFMYDTPRAELCCDIGKHFFDRKEYKKAVYWYEVARATPMNEMSGAFVRKDCYGYIPCLQLCVCWWNLGNMEKAKQYNEMAGACKESEIVNKNRAFFT